MKATIVLDGLTAAQLIAVEDMLWEWQRLGSWGSSRWTCFFADGDGNFRPRITINDNPPKPTSLIDRSKLWTGGSEVSGEYRIDFDAVAWKLREMEDSK
jgi:hypothetical protein